MPSDREISQFIEFCERVEFQDRDEGSYPVITYFGPVNEASLDLDGVRKAGQHIRAYCLGIYYGIPTTKLPDYMFNMNYAPDEQRFRDTFPLADWNGVWILQGHGEPQDLSGGMMKTSTFYRKWAQPLFQQDNFRYGLIKACHAARQGNDESAIEKLARMHKDKNIILYGANAVTWVPLAGTYIGCPVISLSDVYYKKTQDFGNYYTESFAHANNCMKDNYVWSDMVPYLTDAYYELVGFSPENALPISQNTCGSNPDINWYGTGLE